MTGFPACKFSFCKRLLGVVSRAETTPKPFQNQCDKPFESPASRLFLPNAIQMRLRAQVNGIADRGGRRHAAAIEFVNGQRFILFTRRQHMGLVFLIADVNAAIGQDRRSAKIAT